MITGLGGSTIWSSDLRAKLLPFYRDVLELTPTNDTPEFVVFGPEGVAAFCLGTHSEVKGNASDPHRHMVGFTSTDIQADVARMEAAGAEILEAPNDQGGGFWLATFKDPEGNICQLFQMPA